jgi:D-alanyl-D-alanine carboxypeptidase (penicillin-binding protein 5/6)
VFQQLSIALGILVLAFGTTYLNDILALLNLDDDPNTSTQSAQVVSAVTEIDSEPIDYFEDVSLTAHSAYVWDVREQKALYNTNADSKWPLASVTKLMTALVAYNLLESGTAITIPAEAIKQDGGSGLTDGETFELQDLIDLVLMSSSNDGAYALAIAAGEGLGDVNTPADTFIRAMNIRANEIGLSQTHFNNVTGLDIDESNAGAYGSARDIAFLMEYIITNHPDILAFTKDGRTRIRNRDGAFHDVENTNEITNKIQGIFASKTGYTDLAGGNLVIAFDAGLNHPIIVSVLGSTYEGRFLDVLELAKRARAQITQGN